MNDKVTRIKFWCNNVEKLTDRADFWWSYAFTAVCNRENMKIWERIPNGSITLNSIKDNLFEIGKQYYIDFIEAKNE
jgi:hypothetical protein